MTQYQNQLILAIGNAVLAALLAIVVAAFVSWMR